MQIGLGAPTGTLTHDGRGHDLIGPDLDDAVVLVLAE
jgi:hypothetical protein